MFLYFNHSIISLTLKFKIVYFLNSFGVLFFVFVLFCLLPWSTKVKNYEDLCWSLHTIMINGTEDFRLDS